MSKPELPSPVFVSLSGISISWALKSLRKLWYVPPVVALLSMLMLVGTHFRNGQGYKAMAALQMPEKIAREEKLVLESRDLQLKTLENNPRLTLYFKPDIPQFQIPFKIKFPSELRALYDQEFMVNFLSDQLFEVSWEDKNGVQTQSGGFGIPFEIMGQNLRFDYNAGVPKPQKGDNFTFELAAPRRFLLDNSGALKVANEKQTASMIRISFFDPDAVRARDFVESLISTYREQRLVAQRDTLEKKVKMIQEELESQEGVLGLGEEEELPPAIKKEYLELESESQIARESLLSLENRRSKLDFRINQLEKLKRGSLDLNEEEIALVFASENQHLVPLQRAWSQYDSLAKAFDAGNPGQAGQTFEQLEALQQSVMNLATESWRQDRLALNVLGRQIRDREKKYEVFLNEKSELLYYTSGTTLGEKRSLIHWGRYPGIFQTWLKTKERLAAVSPGFSLLETPHLTRIPMRSQLINSSILGLLGGFFLGIVLTLVLSLGTPRLNHISQLSGLSHLEYIPETQNDFVEQTVSWVEIHCPEFPKLIALHSYEERPERERVATELMKKYLEMGKTVRLHSWDAHIHPGEKGSSLNSPPLLSPVAWSELKTSWGREAEVTILINRPLGKQISARIPQQVADVNLLITKKETTRRADLRALDQSLEGIVGVLMIS
ncbi:MAG: hypothetical protein H6581_07495 [Bacteroidia bacterium]|nr:hypothetical protein [Bacteroidia bacterium]